MSSHLLETPGLRPGGGRGKSSLPGGEEGAFIREKDPIAKGGTVRKTSRGAGVKRGDAVAIMEGEGVVT